MRDTVVGRLLSYVRDTVELYSKYRHSFANESWDDILNLTKTAPLFLQTTYTYTVFENQPKMSHLSFRILAFSTNFCPFQIDLSGNTVWPQASDFLKLAKMGIFWHLWFTYVHSNCKHSSLRSQCYMRLFLWFSNTVPRCNFATCAVLRCLLFKPHLAKIWSARKNALFSEKDGGMHEYFLFKGLKDILA